MPEKQRHENNNKKKVLFFALNSPGHINSSLGIADVLKERGYNTIFMTLGPLMVKNVEQNGHQIVFLDDTEPYCDNNKVYTGAAKWPVIIEKCRKYLSMSPLEACVNLVDICDSEMIRECKCYNDRYGKTIDSIDPDVIICDQYFVPPCVVNSKRPWARIYSANPLGLATSEDCPPSHGGFSIPSKELMASEQPEKWLELKREWLHFKQQLNIRTNSFRIKWSNYLQSQGCPPLPDDAITHDSPHLNLYMFPKCLDYDNVRPYPRRWLRCDSMMRKTGNIPDDSDGPMNEFIANSKQLGKKVIFFSMGSLASGDIKLMKNLIDILSRSPHQFVVAKGIRGDELELSSKNMWGDKFVSQTIALSKVDMAVIHGGNNTLTECFYYGCPIIVLPAFSDQFDNAQRIVDLGFGQRFSPFDPDEKQLLAAIEDIINDQELSKRMKEISKDMKSKDGALKGADLIEILANDGSIDDSTIDKFRDM